MTVLLPRLRAVRSSRYLADAVLAAGLAMFAVLFDALGPDARSTASLVWDVVLAAPLVLRRRDPAAVAAVVAALCLVQWSADVLATGDFAYLIVLYTVGAHARQRWLLPAAVGTAAIGVVLAVSRWAPNEAFNTAILLTGTVTAACVLGVYVRTRRAYIESVLGRAETAERERDSRAQVAVAEERARIAREMHDVIAHSLSIMITLNDAAAAVEVLPQVRATVEQAAEVGRQALAEMQSMLGVLRHDGSAQLDPQPGADQLAELVGTLRAAGLATELTVTGDLSTVAATVQLSVYRIVQESLTNIVKHARNVNHVNVDIAREPGSIAITVANDGDLVATSASRAAGHGLDGMRERTQIYGGGVQARPNPAGGWTTQATLPLIASELIR